MDEKFMRAALVLASEAAAGGDVPVGAVVTRRGEIVGSGRNRREQDQDAIAHAEIEAIRQACRALGSWRLEDCQLYVTLEPCPMCMGAIVNARIQTMYFGAYSPTGGRLEPEDSSALLFGHKPDIWGGVLEEECGTALTDFFKDIR